MFNKLIKKDGTLKLQDYEINDQLSLKNYRKGEGKQKRGDVIKIFGRRRLIRDSEL